MTERAVFLVELNKFNQYAAKNNLIHLVHLARRIGASNQYRVHAQTMYTVMGDLLNGKKYMLREISVFRASNRILLLPVTSHLTCCVRKKSSMFAIYGIFSLRY